MSHESQIGSPLPSTVNFPKTNENTGPTNAILFDDGGLKYKGHVKPAGYFFGFKKSSGQVLQTDKYMPMYFNGSIGGWDVSIEYGDYIHLDPNSSPNPPSKIFLKKGFLYSLNSVVLINTDKTQVDARWNITGKYNGHIQNPGPQNAMFNKDYPRPTGGVIEALEDLVVFVEAKITTSVSPGLAEIYNGAHAEVNLIGKSFDFEDDFTPPHEEKNLKK